MSLAGGGTAEARRPRRVRVALRLAAGGAAVVLVTLAGCGDDSPGNGASSSRIDVSPVAEVHVTDSGVQPAALVIGQGEAVGVTNDGTRDHRLTSDQYDTGVLRPGDSTLLFGSQIGHFELKADTASVTALVITVEPGNSSSAGGAPDGPG